MIRHLQECDQITWACSAQSADMMPKRLKKQESNAKKVHSSAMRFFKD